MSHKKLQDAARCPLCDRHCPLSAPHCRKGEKYARKLAGKAAPEPTALEEPIPLGIDDTLFVQLRSGSRHILRQYRDSGSRHRILGVLLEHEKVSQRALQELIGVKPGSLSELLAKLEKKGLIRRKKNDTDKRNRDVTLTEAGRAVAQLRAAQSPQALFSALSEDEKAQLSGLLDKLLAAWDNTKKADGKRGSKNNQKSDKDAAKAVGEKQPETTGDAESSAAASGSEIQQ